MREVASFTPLGGLVPLANIMLSEVIFGGVGALTFFPALSLGPIVEHLLMVAGKTF